MKEDFRVIIAGGRDFSNYELMCMEVDYLLSEKIKTHNIIVISGKAKGADTLGEKYATEHGLSIESYPADWNRHGKSAGFIHNVEMAEKADALIAFWNGKSNGTRHMINTARKNKMLVRIIYY